MQIKLTDIRRGMNHRKLNESTVAALVESLPSLGQISPIIVKESQIMRERLEPGYLLIAGNHRLTAAERLEWETIEADVWPADTNAVRLEMIEVDENLCRAELTAAEKARAIKLRKTLWESLKEHENSGHEVSTIRGPGMPQGFATSTAAVTGMGKTAVNQYLKIAEVLGDDLERIQGTELDSKTKLMELVEKTEEARAAILATVMASPEVQDAIAPKEDKPPKPKATKDERDEDAEAKKLSNRIIRQFQRLPDKYQRAIREAIAAI
jgi:ParB/RepB/Spo0J family partition protein